MTDESVSKVNREDCRVVVHDGEPAIQVGDALIAFEVMHEGAKPESVEKDFYDFPYFILEFPDDYSGLMEITPRFVPAEERDGDE